MGLSHWRRLQFGFYRFMEPRAIMEWQSFYVLLPLLRKLPKGDGHSVIVFPGFVSSDVSTRPLRRLLKDLGYHCLGWGLGRNLVFNDALEAEIIALVDEEFQRSGRKVSLIGWSLGGLYAREVAKSLDCAGKIRSVISLGSPISGNASHSNAHGLFQAINGAPTDIDFSRYHKLNEPPSVPTTSIYSKTDGIVAWEGSVQKRHAQTENIELPASHLGIGVNPFAMYAIADRLSQKEGEWRRFNVSGIRSLFYRRPKQGLFKTGLLNRA